MFGWRVSNSTCLKYGQTSLLISRVCWTWCQSHILGMCLLQPITTMPTTSPTTLTHRPTTTHLRFATGWHDPSHPRTLTTTQQNTTTTQQATSAHEKDTRPWLDPCTQLKQHHWRRPCSLVRWPAPSTSPNSKCKAAMPNSLICTYHSPMVSIWTPYGMGGLHGFHMNGV